MNRSKMKYNTNPRLALVIPRDSFVYRGTGSVARGILNWAMRNDYSVDVISDQPYRPNDMFKPYIGRFKWIYGSEHSIDEIHRDLDTYNRVINTEMVTRIKNSLVKAIEQYSYGAIITNTAESLMATTSIGLHTTDTVCHITHNETEAGLTGVNLSRQQFANGIGAVWQSQCALDGVRLLVQSDWLKQHTHNFYKHKTDDIETYPLFLTDGGDTIKPSARFGIGTIGPVEPRKANDVFIDFCKKMGKTARMLAPTKISADKFIKRCNEAGVPCEVKYGLAGYEKRQWIASLALAYHPSYCESFGLGALETAEFTPTILRKDREWSQAHEEYCFVLDEADLVDVGQQLYGQDVPHTHKDAWTARNNRAELQWHNIARQNDKPINATWKQMLDNDKILNVSALGKLDRRKAAITQDTVIKMARLATNENIEQLNTVNQQWIREKGSDAQPTQTENNGSFEAFFELA